MHSFEVGDQRYGEPGDFDDGSRQREAIVRVHEVLGAPGDRITYGYDFGDDWYHDIVVEELLSPRSSGQCLAGR